MGWIRKSGSRPGVAAESEGIRMDKAMRSVVIASVSLGMVLVGCSEVGITGRSQLNLVPDSIINSMSLKEYDTFIASSKLSTDTAKTEMVKRVGTRIVKAVGEYCKTKGIEDPLASYDWEFNLVVDPNVNAFAMPGGKVVVYTGLLPVAQSETGLAVVVGHEIAHVFAKHGAERMTQQLLVKGGGMALSEALKEKPAETQNLFMTSYGLGTQIGILLPYSRTHESEADHLGLIFMAMAGYDPHEAVMFWERMAAQSSGSKPPELLSTHPADETRIKDIERLLPEAMEYYKPQM
jgi:predicted Zn-dependent protease